MFIHFSCNRTCKLSFIVLPLTLLAFLLAGCNSLGPDQAEKLIEYINNGDTQAANQYVCKDKQNTFVDELSKESAIIKKDEEVLGLKSPGINDIQCQKEDNYVECAFTVPKLICSGLDLNNMTQENPTITCTSFDPLGDQVTVHLTVANGKFCGFTVQKSK